jgi:hypothetical protein
MKSQQGDVESNIFHGLFEFISLCLISIETPIQSGVGSDTGPADRRHISPCATA